MLEITPEITSYNLEENIYENVEGQNWKVSRREEYSLYECRPPTKEDTLFNPLSHI